MRQMRDGGLLKNLMATVALMAAVALLAPLVALAQEGESGSEDEEVTVVGVVVETGWDDETGEVDAVGIQSDEGPVYNVEPGGYGKWLLDLVGRRVSAQGYVTIEDDGDLSLYVSGYSVL